MNRYPLSWPPGWPRFQGGRKDGSFGKVSSRTVDQTKIGGGVYTAKDFRRLSISEACIRIFEELRHFKVDVQNDVIISTNVKTRLDGLPRSDQAEPSDPGAAVYWQLKGGAAPRVMAIDRYTRVGDNLGAIAATLNAMRAIERHGGAQILERAFTGFEALPAPSNCWDILGMGDLADEATEDMIQDAYRAMARMRHPDVAGGSVDQMSELNVARDEALRRISGR